MAIPEDIAAKCDISEPHEPVWVQQCSARIATGYWLAASPRSPSRKVLDSGARERSAVG
jgi:hypothetical protein